MCDTNVYQSRSCWYLPCTRNTISFQTFFVWALLLIVHTWNSSPIRSNLLWLQCTCCTVPTTFGRPHGSPLVRACQWPSSRPLSSPQLSHNNSLWAWGITKCHREQRLDYREGEELSWCPSWSNSLWKGWSCELVYCSGGNATDSIWRVLASSKGISSWTPLKPQHSIPCWLSVQWEPSACRSCQWCQKKGSSKVCGWICSVWPSWVWESQHASTGNSVSWSLGHSSKSSFRRRSPEHQELRDLNWSARPFPCYHDNVFLSDLLWAPLGQNLPHLQFLANNCVYCSHTDIKMCTYCLYRHTTVLIHEILYLANQLWCSDFLTPLTPLIIPHRLPAFLESLMPLKNWCSIHARWSKSSLKHSIRSYGIFSKFKTEFYCISFF